MAKESQSEKGVSRFSPPTHPVAINTLSLPAGTTLFRVHRQQSGKKLIHSDASDYAITRQWAEAIHRQHPHIQGLMWPSRQHQGNAWLLFGDRIDSTLLVRESKTQKITERPVVEDLLALADRMGIYLEE